MSEVKLKVQRKNGNWYTVIDGQEHGVDWYDEIYDADWEYTHEGVTGRVIFLDVHDGDDPYFSSQKDADKQLMRVLTLTPDTEFARYMCAFDEKTDKEYNLADVMARMETA